MYLAYRRALQEVVSRQLTAWGDVRTDPQAQPRPARLDRDLERVLEDLADEFPLLHSLVERRPGGQKRLPMASRAAVQEMRPLYSLISSAEAEIERQAPPAGSDSKLSPDTPAAPPEQSPPAGHHEAAAAWIGIHTTTREVRIDDPVRTAPGR